jgi:hypothetical protein
LPGTLCVGDQEVSGMPACSSIPASPSNMQRGWCASGQPVLNAIGLGRRGCGQGGKDILHPANVTY